MLYKNNPKVIHAALIQLIQLAQRSQDQILRNQRKLYITSDQPKMISKMANIKKVNFKTTQLQEETGLMLLKSHRMVIHAVLTHLIQIAHGTIKKLPNPRKLFIHLEEMVTIMEGQFLITQVQAENGLQPLHKNQKNL